MICSVTSVGHAETGRPWQGRAFLDKADEALPLPPAVPVTVTRVTVRWLDGSGQTVYPPAFPKARCPR